MADVSADGFLSAARCVSDSFHIEKFRETNQDSILNLLKGKDILSLTANGLRKICMFFSPSRLSSDSFLDVADCYPYFQVQLIGKGFGWVPLMKPVVSW